jgi:hypothetical protein
VAPDTIQTLTEGTWRTAWRSLVNETAKRAGNAAAGAALNQRVAADPAETSGRKQGRPSRVCAFTIYGTARLRNWPKARRAIKSSWR